MKFLRFKLLIFSLTILFSCAHRNTGQRTTGGSPNFFAHRSDLFEWSDKAGKFELLRESGRSSQKSDYVVRQRLRLSGGDREIVEQSVAISELGRLRNEVSIMRPKRSQYTVWFDGERYLSEMEMDIETKSMKVRLTSPEAEWNGERSVQFPEDNTVYCFFSAVIECAFMTGFIETAMKREAGRMNFYIVWDGYPFLMQQYVEIPEEVFSRAVLEYDGSENEKNRFVLRFAGQSIFYFVHPSGRYERLFWVGQGLSVVKRGSSNEGR